MRCHVFTLLSCLFSNIYMIVKKYFFSWSLLEHSELGCLIFQKCFVSKIKVSPKTNIAQVSRDKDDEKKHLSKCCTALNLELSCCNVKILPFQVVLQQIKLREYQFKHDAVKYNWNHQTSFFKKLNWYRVCKKHYTCYHLMLSTVLYISTFFPQAKYMYLQCIMLLVHCHMQV